LVALISVVAALGVAISMVPPEREIAAVGGLALLAAVGLTIRFRWFPVVTCWIVIACVSSFKLTGARIVIGGVPVGVVDVLALLLGLGWMCRVWQNNLHRQTIHNGIPPVWVALAVYAVLGLGVGYVHGYGWYFVMIDVRTVLYLCVGYWAAMHLTDAKRDSGMIAALLWVTLAGFIFAQATAWTTGLQQFESTGGSLEDYRDIGSPIFVGKYGLFLAAVLVMERRFVYSWWAAGLLIVGVVAVAASFVRSGWVSVAIGFVLLLLVIRGKGVPRLAGVIAAIGVIATLLIMTVPPSSEFFQALQHRLQDVLAPPSDYHDTVGSRFQESQAALSSLKSVTDWIFGVGLGYVVPGNTNPFQHNSVVWLLSKQGFLGLALFVIVVVLIPVSRLRTGLEVLSGQRRQLLLVLVAAQMANLASGYASGNLTYWPYMALIGIAMAWIDQLAASRDVGAELGESYGRAPRLIPFGSVGNE
jgi:hypothetical protein